MVPNGWRIITLGEVVTHKKGFAFKSSSYTSSGTRLIRISDTTRNSVHDNSPVYISHEEAEVLSEHKLSTSDIILSTVGSRPHLLDSMVGKAIQIPSKDNGSLLNQNLVKLIPKKDRITNQYLFAMLKIKKFNHFISTLIRGNANQVSITLKELFEYSFLLPPLLEQQKIAKILTTWDKAIDTTERLIDNSKQQKKALMQQLLTGKKRLLDDNGKPFEGDWKRVELGTLLDYEQPAKYLVKSTEYSDEYSTPVLTAGKTFILGYTNEDFGIFEENLPTIIFDDFTTASKFVDFPFKAKSSAMKMLIAKESVSIKFVYEAMQVMNFPVGGHKRHWISTFSNLTIPLPSLEEQQKIAAVLTNADNEIELLEQQLTDLQQEKKALMQQLLTGKKRVRLND